MHSTRIKLAFAIFVVLALFAGLLLQDRWNADCARTMPGTHWNGDDWLCVAN